VLQIHSGLDSNRQRALETLLSSHLSRTRVELSIERSTAPAQQFIRDSRRIPGVLLVVILREVEARKELVIVDAARGRAIVRHLDEDETTNAATLEAVASIVASAAAALLEGLEVASERLEAVLLPEQPTRAPTPPRPVPPRQADTGNTLQNNDQQRAANSRERSAIVVRGSLGAAAASFADAAPVSGGLSSSLSLAFRAPVTLRCGVAAYLPARFSTALGEFEVGRTTAALTLGTRFDVANAQLEPELGVAGELLRRTSPRALAGVSARGATAWTRFGPLLGARLRVPLGAFTGLELSGFAAYFPREIRFVALSTAMRNLGQPWALSVGGGAAFEIRSE
jgi:hypothetical protein